LFDYILFIQRYSFLLK